MKPSENSILIVIPVLVLASCLTAADPNVPTTSDGANATGRYSITLTGVELNRDSFCFKCFVDVTPESKRPLLVVLPFTLAQGTSWHIQPCPQIPFWLSGKLPSVEGCTLLIFPRSPHKELQFVASNAKVPIERHEGTTGAQPTLCLDFPTCLKEAKEYAENSEVLVAILDEIKIRSNLAIMSMVPMPEKQVEDNPFECEINIGFEERSAVIVTFERPSTLWLWYLLCAGAATIYALVTIRKMVNTKNKRRYLVGGIMGIAVFSIIAYMTEQHLPEIAFKSVLLGLLLSLIGVAGASALLAMLRYLEPADTFI